MTFTKTSGKVFSVMFIGILAMATLGSSVLQALKPISNSVPVTFFGLHMHRFASTTPWPAIPFGAWRMIAAHVDWVDLEPSPGRWSFDTLDHYVSAAQSHNVEPLVTLVTTPAWASSRPYERAAARPGAAAPPKNIEDWKTYVREVATRYKGRVHDYEIWNEPNLKDFYTGSVDELVVLTREAQKILKDVDPSNVVVSPACTGEPGLQYLNEYLEKGGGEYVDVVAYHFYVTPDPPEAMLSRIQKVHSLMSQHGIANKPLWNTETGWLIENRQTEVKSRAGSFSKVLKEPEAAGYVARSFLLAWAAGVSRFYWYAWDNWETGLTDKDGKTLKAPAKAYGNVERWLVGAKVLMCAQNQQRTWVCDISRPGGYKGWIMWNPDHTYNFKFPPDSEFKYVEYLTGDKLALKNIHDRDVGPAPILLENQEALPH